ncbi:MAG: aminotransferase class V-fold PLP-dependent enzyme [Saprospiraceae bacterium]|nr:aminotransferase class V-fold PLP-dependent enzyme [Saprospiraceae bacterium]
MFDINQIRKDTPASQQLIHFNNAGASLNPSVVIQKVKDYLDLEAQIGGYEVERLHQNDIKAFYTEMARLIHAEPHNIAFATSCTDAYARALSSMPFKSGDVILTSDDDYASNQLCFLSLQNRVGVRVVRAKNFDNGDMDVADVERIIKTEHPSVVAITHIPTSSGKMQPVAEIGQLCRQYDVWYLVDACQSIGQMPIDVQSIGCDFLTATGRKFLRAPRGTGFLFVSDKALEAGFSPLYFDNHSGNWTGKDSYTMQASALRFELYERSLATVLGITEAVRYACAIGLDNIWAYNQDLAQYFRQELQNTEGVTLYDEGSQLCNIITFRMGHKPLEVIQSALNAARINHSVTMKKMAQIDFDRKGIDWALRFSPHYYNTKEEVDKVIEVLRAI